MNDPGFKTRFVSSPVAILAVAAVYAVVAKVSFLFTIPPGNITPIFPAAGLALAAVMMIGRNALIGVWLGSFVANTISFIDGSMPSVHTALANFLVGAFIGLGAMSGAAAGAFLVRRFCKDEHPLQSGRNVLILVTVGALGCCMISPTFGMLSLSLGGNVPWERFGYSWVTWWVGDAAGTLVAAPLILAWQHRHPFRKNARRILEAVVLGGTTFLVCFYVFFRNMPFEYGLLPLLLWAAFRFGMRGASTTAVVIALLATIGTSRGSSEFVGATANESLLLLNSFFGVTITCALFLAGMMEKQRRADEELGKLNGALRESEERVRLLGDNLPDSYVYQYTFKPDGAPQFLYLSAGVERLHGVKVSDALRDASVLHRQIAPEQAAAMRAAEATSLQNLTDFTMELRMRRADGQWRWMQLCSRPRRTSVGQVLWDGVATDITKRKQAAEALHESERKYRELVEHANSIILHWTRDGRIIFLNEFGQRFFGYTEAEICGRHVIGTIVPETETGGRDLTPLMDEICANPAAFEQNVNENMRRNGERVWIAWTNKVVLDPQGQVVEILSIGTDITKRKRTEEALRASEAKFRVLADGTALAIFIYRGEHYCYTNPAFQAMTGYNEAELLKMHFWDVAHPEFQEKVRTRGLARQQQKQALKRYEFKILTKSMEERWLDFTDGAIEFEGQPATLGTALDITERKRAEEEVGRLHEELQRRAQELERRVLVRTAELAVAKDRAEAADRLKSAFLATMSHELRTPLNSIIGFTGIILQGLAGPLNPEQSKQLEMVRGSARHLLALINDVLDISKIEAGQLEVACKPFDLRASIEKVAGSMKPLADKKGLALHVGLASEIGAWVSDQQRVEQILINLLNNAIKFTERGQVTLAAKTAQGALCISVTDTGIGIKADDLQKLFQPFRQIDTGLARNHEGTGLGLAICRRLAELLGGEVRAESQWGKGSTFTVVLPVKGGVIS